MEDDTISPHPLRNGDNDSRRSLTPNTVHCTPPPSSPTPSLPSTDQTSDIPLTQAVLRLIQCSQCSRPLQTPLRLPCGNTVCRGCLPPLHRRRGVTYPATEERKDGFTCSACLGEHCVGDCGTDVLLTRLVEVFDEVLRSDATEAGESPNGEDGLRGGMEELYALIRANRFDYNAYGGTCERDGQTDARSAMVLARLTERLRGELDCHVCYSLILDPLTTCCGHTFCHRCVAMVLDHSDLCPVCRRKLNMSSTLQCEPVNKRVAALIETLFPEQIASRREASALEESNPNETSLPLFVSSLSLPTMPTFLHIFEPRYRLMIRRVMQSRGRKFGMVMYNRAGRLQEGLGRSQFLQYGTVLVVDRYELLPDGRSLVVATGVSRFKVLGSVLVDGYHVGRIQRVEDISITEEEAREALETSATAVDAVEGSERPLDSMSTQELFQFGLDFVRRQHGQGAVWLRPRALLAYGDIPTDPVRFPWWFASILPVWEEEKYALLSATSVRERLKITARWIRKLESRQWYVPRACLASDTSSIQSTHHLPLQAGSPPPVRRGCVMTSRPAPHLCCASYNPGGRYHVPTAGIERLYHLHTLLHVRICFVRLGWPLYCQQWPATLPTRGLRDASSPDCRSEYISGHLPGAGGRQCGASLANEAAQPSRSSRATAYDASTGQSSRRG